MQVKPLDKRTPHLPFGLPTPTSTPLHRLVRAVTSFGKTSSIVLKSGFIDEKGWNALPNTESQNHRYSTLFIANKPHFLNYSEKHHDTLSLTTKNAKETKKHCHKTISRKSRGAKTRLRSQVVCSSSIHKSL